MLAIGQKVRLKDIDSFLSEVRNKCGNGRVGIVTGHTSQSNHPLVTFPPVGRKKEFRFGQCRESWLECVED